MTGIRQQIVVGLDGSPESLTAARWAAREARLRDVPLQLLHAFDVTVTGLLGYAAPVALTDELYQSGKELVDSATHDLRQEYADLEITGRLVHSDPRPVLVEASEGAMLTVVGTRGGGRIPEVILGSVALHVAAHGRSPIAVIPAVAVAGSTGPILLGVDGSPTSEAAIQFAFDQADRRRAPLRAVLVWDDVALRGFTVGGTLIEPLGEERQHAVLAEQLAGWREKYPDVPVEQVVRRGRAAEALLRDRTQDPPPQMIVVGSRGRGGFTGLLLGSTSHALIGHSQWPVVVVRRAEH